MDGKFLSESARDIADEPGQPPVVVAFVEICIERVSDAYKYQCRYRKVFHGSLQTEEPDAS